MIYSPPFGKRPASIGEAHVLFVVTYRNKEAMTEAEEKRSLDLFTKWTPPAGFEFKFVRRTHEVDSACGHPLPRGR